MVYEKVFFYYKVKLAGGYNIINLSIPVFKWDLYDYASTIKITAEEVDLTETFTLTDTRSAQYATNFEINGTIQKVGLKFGSSFQINTTSSTTYSVTKQSDPLGDVIVNFADKVIIDDDYSISLGKQAYDTQEYGSGLYVISVEPKKVQ